MKRYIIHEFDSDGGHLVCTVDSLDDIIDEYVEVIDTHTGEIYHYRNGTWEKGGNADDVKPGYLERKSDPPVEPREVKEVEGGVLVPPGFRDMLVGRIQTMSKEILHSVPFVSADLEITCADIEIPFLGDE